MTLKLKSEHLHSICVIYIYYPLGSNYAKDPTEKGKVASVTSAYRREVSSVLRICNRETELRGFCEEMSWHLTEKEGWTRYRGGVCVVKSILDRGSSLCLGPVARGSIMLVRPTCGDQGAGGEVCAEARQQGRGQWQTRKSRRTLFSNSCR